MAITASDVKKLREMTGAGMMDCKKALSETSGDMEQAVDFLRTKGLAAAQKKQSRVAAEGTVITLDGNGKGIILEVNCETDFVSKGNDFQNFAKSVAQYALDNDIADLETLKSAKSEEINELTLKCGEKVDVRRMEVIATDGALGAYNHGGKIGVLVDLATTEKTNEDIEGLLKDLAMHVAAASPKFLNASDIDEDFKVREAAVYEAQLKEEGKPENMIPNIIKGKLNKLASEVCLMDQKFVKDPDVTVKKLVEAISAKTGIELSVKGFYKLNLGEGIEKKEDNLADEVAKMTQK